MRKKVSITIPLYLYQKTNDLYDHPTLLSQFTQTETCSRLLSSLIAKRPDGVDLDITLLYGRTNEGDVNNHAIDVLLQKTILHTIQPAQSMKIFIAGKTFLDALADCLSLYKNVFSPSNIRYGNIRNLQLLIQLIKGDTYQINLDDDEIVASEKFYSQLEKIISYMNKDKKIGGVGGLYVDQYGNPDILSNTQQERLVKNIYSQKEYLMQQMISQYAQQEWTSPASSVFGGLTCMRHELVKNVCYDPYTPRGEDIDFLIHALFKQYCFTMNKSWTIIHKPPGKTLGSSHIPTREKKIRDVKRFLYQKKKIDALAKSSGIAKKEILSILLPYPGIYFQASTGQLIADAEDICQKEELEEFLKKEVPVKIVEFQRLWRLWPAITERVEQHKKELAKSLVRIL